MTTPTRTEPDVLEVEAVPTTSAPESETTAAGLGLQAAWAGYVLYGLWLSSSGPEHPVPPAWVDALLSLLMISVLAVTAGILGRRRWALWGSAALALPMVGLAVMCFQADAGNHWVAEAGFAAAIVAGSFHPASWRMHTRRSVVAPS